MIYFLIYIWLITEYWKEIPMFFWKYSASCFWRIRNNTRKSSNDCMFQVSHKDYEYMQINLRWNNKRQTYRVHRLVLEAFEWESTLDVNHIVWDKRNNNIFNLEYCSKKENISHAIKNNLIKRWWLSYRSKPVVQILNTWEEIYYAWTREAERETWVHSWSICRSCNKWYKAWWYNWKWQIAA